MTKLRVFSLVAAIAIPMLAHAGPAPAPAPAPAGDIELDGGCKDEQTCMAEELADALSGQPSGHAVQLDSLITFGGGTARVYSSGREKLEALARSWHEHPRWSKITVEGYADARNNAGLAQQRADKVRGYLIRYGVAAEYVVAIGHDQRADDAPRRRATTGRVDLTIALCDQASTDCRVKRLPGAPGAGAQ